MTSFYVPTGRPEADSLLERKFAGCVGYIHTCFKSFDFLINNDTRLIIDEDIPADNSIETNFDQLLTALLSARNNFDIE